MATISQLMYVPAASPIAVHPASEIPVVSNARKSHQKPAAHVGSFGTHRGYERTEFSATQIEIVSTVVFLGTSETNIDHTNKVYDNGNHDAYLCRCHK